MTPYGITIYTTKTKHNKTPHFIVVFFHDSVEQIICPAASCIGRCNEIADDVHPCSCDVQCQGVGDCCMDAKQRCLQSALKDPRPLPGDLRSASAEADPLPDANKLENLSKPIKSDCWLLRSESGPVVNGNVDVGLIAMRIVTECPKDGIVKNVESVPVEHHIPVCHMGSQLLFRNIFLAFCFGLDAADVVPFQLRLGYKSALFETLGTESYTQNKAIINAMWENAVDVEFFKIPEECIAIVNRQHCDFHKDDSDDMCPDYSDPVVITGRDKVYKNKFCVPEQNVSLSCYKGAPDLPVYVKHMPSIMIHSDLCANHRTLCALAIPMENGTVSRSSHISCCDKEPGKKSVNKSAILTRYHVINFVMLAAIIRSVY